MRSVIHKWFWVWDFEKEEQWLNEMAAQGLALISAGFCRYEFEDSAPGEYQVCLQFLEGSSAEKEAYIRFLTDTGVEYVGSMVRWAYFRRRSEDGPFSLFSDTASRVSYLTGVLRFVLIISAMNLYIGGYNLFLWLHWGSGLNVMGIVNSCIAVLGFFGASRLWRKRNALKSEQQLFE